MITTDVYPGKDLGTLELTITDEMVQHYIKGLDEPNPWYTTASPFGGPVAPVIVYQQADSEFKGWYLDNLFGNLWRRQEWEIYAPTRVGQVLRCSARVADRYRRRDREIVAQEMSVRDEAGDLVARSVHHQSFLAEQTSGEVALRDPASKEGAKQGDEPAGEALSLELRKDLHRSDVQRVLLIALLAVPEQSEGAALRCCPSAKVRHLHSLTFAP